MIRGLHLLVAFSLSFGAASLLTACSAKDAPRASAEARAVARNLAAISVMPPARIDSLLADERDQPVARRVGRWARRFLAAGTAEYRFGLADGGYVAEGALVSDDRHDCVSLLYRATELARARDAADAVRLALSLRFAGADLDSVVAADGRVDYDRPEHLDYSLDMVRSGLWGEDVTASLRGAVPDTAGSARYPAGSFSYLPTAAVDAADLHEGDVAWLVLDPDHAGARALRREHGLVVGHIGIVIVEDRRPWLVHAARSDLPGWYAGGGIVAVPLGVYLERVESFAGVVVTRFG